MEIYVPGQVPEEEALKRTTHLAVAAHQDDIEFMAYHGVLQCVDSPDQFFTAAVVTNGSGSPRSGAYAGCSDEDMMKIRREEQKKAADIGGYSAQFFLDFPSSAVKNSGNRTVIDDLKQIIQKTQPKVIYTHNLADKHITHVAVALRLIAALRELEYQPEKLYGCEVWRALDWINDDEKVKFDVSGKPELEKELLQVFDSQIAGGKRYDLAVIGRRLANATFCESHGVDQAQSVTYAMDLTPLVKDPALDIREYVLSYISRFYENVKENISTMS